MQIDYYKLIERPPMQFPCDKVKSLVRGMTILVTGAGGSLGGELCKRLLDFCPRKLYILDSDENSIYNLEQDLLELNRKPQIGSVILTLQNKDGLERFIKIAKPEIVYHLAAHKHVPLMELNSLEALENNLYGTVNLVNILLDSHKLKKFVFVSSDKSVNPRGVYGFSKEMGERWIRETQDDRFLTVRLANVLGSRGSIMPLFIKQIKAGMPVTLTHPKASRYFMTPEEAINFLLSIITLKTQNKIYIPNIQQDILIQKVIENLCNQLGVKKRIKIINLRPGERLEEKLYSDDEKPVKTKYESILMLEEIK